MEQALQASRPNLRFQKNLQTWLNLARDRSRFINYAPIVFRKFSFRQKPGGTTYLFQINPLVVGLPKVSRFRSLWLYVQLNAL